MGRAIVVVLLAMIAGCGTFEVKGSKHTAPDGRVFDFSKISCQMAVHYQGYSVTVENLNLPSTAAGKSVFSVGKVGISPTKITDASEAVKRLDLLQYHYCQNAIMLTDEQDKLKYFMSQDDTVKAMLGSLDKMQAANTDASLESATTSTTQAATQLKSSGPPVSTTPSTPGPH